MPELDLATHLLVALAAFVISFLSATAGLTGAFLLLPFQISVLGLGAPSVSATNHLYNVVAAPGGFSGYREQGRMVWPLAWAMVVGTVPGILGGIVLRVRYLPDPAVFKTFAGCVLAGLGALLLFRTLQERRGGGPTAPPGAQVQILSAEWRRLRYRYGNQEYSVPLLTLAIFSTAVGVVGGAYGVGGGVFTSAFLVGVYRLPIHTTAGATLLSTFVASCVGALGFTVLAWLRVPWAVDASPVWTLGLALGVGGLLGGRLGSKVQRFLPSTLIAGVLAVFLLLLGASYVAGFR